MHDLIQYFGFLDFNGREFIQDWGYIAVLLGSMVEGESIIFAAGLLAHEGYLSIYKVTLIAFVGTLVADQSLYFMGHFYGKAFLEKFPSLQAKSEKAFRLLHKYNNLFIMSFRFIYGIRILSPLVIGASGIPMRRFMILNLIAAVIWSVSSCAAAYYFAHLLIEYWHVISKIIFGFMIFGAGVLYGIHLWRKRNRR